jgi:hypothetical protein
MSEPLLGSFDFVVSRVDDSLVLVGNTPGPAGSVVLTVDGIEIDVDIAQVGVVNRVAPVPLPSLVPGPSHSLLVRLLGPEAVEALEDYVSSGSVGQHRVVGGRRRTMPPSSTVLALAHAVAASQAHGLLPEEEALSIAEAADLAHQVGIWDHLDDLQGVSAGALAFLAGDAEVAAFAPSVRRRAVEVLDAVMEWAPEELRRGLTNLGERLRREEFEPASRRAAAAASSGSMRSPITVAPDALPLLVAQREPDITRVSNDEYEVRMPGWAERAVDWWARFYVGDDQAPIALVPVVPEGDDAVARALLPEDQLDRLTLEIVADPHSPRSSEHLALFRAALAVGQRASSLERLGRIGEAHQLWLESSDLHRRAGDGWRSEVAQHIAHGDLRGSRAVERRRFDPLTTDLSGPAFD